MVVNLPSCPQTLRSIQPYLKIASEHDERDQIVSYWCRLYSLQTALTIDKKSDEAKNFLLALMDWLESTKKAASSNESITSEVAAQAYIENYALKLFVWADNMDRSGNFNKNVVKSFYTSGMLMDVLTVFGEQNEDIINNKKYAKWKASYIHNCLKTGETPVPGPLYAGNEEENELNELMNIGGTTNYKFPGGAPSFDALHPPNVNSTSNPRIPSELPIQPENNMSYNPHPTPASESPQTVNETKIDLSNGNVKLDPAQITKAQKYCKFASSALNYDDIPEAISNLQKALKLLQTGSEN